jgi:hypothetical protein
MPCNAKSDAWRNGLLLLLFNNVDFVGVGDAGGLLGSVTAGSLYVALHTADPTASGDQESNECAYTSYARVAVARSGSGWTVSGNSVENAAAVTFPEATGGSETATHYSIGTDATGGGIILYSEQLTSPLAIISGVEPKFNAGTLVGTET